MTNEDYEDLNIIRYFWRDKGDPTRCIEWDRISKRFPELLKVWNDFVMARKMIGIVIDGLQDRYTSEDE